MTLWVTFVPCFLWIFTGAPYIQAILARPHLKGALAALSAAVVGVIANLSAWFALYVLFGTVLDTGFGPRPVSASFLPLNADLIALAAALQLGLRWPITGVLAGMAAMAGGVHIIA